MKKKRVNPNRRPASMADVKKAKQQAQDLAVELAWSIFFAEEIADATIMLEQLRQMLNINDSVASWMDYKIAALKRKVER